MTVITAAREPLKGPYQLAPVTYMGLGGRVKRVAGLDDSANLALEASKRGPSAEHVTRFAAGAIERIFLHPDKYRSWIRHVRRYGRAVPLTERPDIVIVSSPPASAAKAAANLAESWQVPLVWDQRDLWTQNPHYPYGPVRRLVDSRSEDALLRRCTAVVTVSDGFAQRLRERNQTLRVTVIRTGLCVEGTAGPRSPREDGPLRLGFFGNTYGGRRDLRVVLRAVRQLVDDGLIRPMDLVVDAYGSVDARVADEAARLGIGDIVCVRDLVPRSVVEDQLARTDVVLSPMWPLDVDMVPLKIVECLCLGKTILVTGAGEDSEVRRMCSVTPGMFACDNEAQVAETLLACMRRLEREGSLDFPDPQRALPYSAATMAAHFAALVKALVEAEPGTDDA